MYIGVDFDGTLAEYEQFRGRDVVGNPIPGAVQFVKALHQLGFRLAIFSARASDPRGKSAIESWVANNGLTPYIELITHEKRPEFEIIVDDRAIHFDGDYRSVLKEVIRRQREQE